MSEEASAWDNFTLGAETLFSVTPVGLITGYTPTELKGSTRAERLEAVTGADLSDRIDSSAGGALAQTAGQISSDPTLPLRRGSDVAAEAATTAGQKLGWLPEWWRPWMTKLAVAAGVLTVGAIAVGPYVAPFIATRRSGGST